MTFGEAAFEYRSQGLAVIPVRRDKRPLVDWRPYQAEAPHPDQVCEWWEQWPNANVAIVTGAVSGVVVLDADGPDGLTSLKSLNTPATTWLSRTGRGLHQWFRHPGVRIPNRTGLRPHLDVRGDGGLVVAPPSIHASGVRYEWLTGPDDLLLAPLPPELAALLRAPVTTDNGARPKPSDIPEGQRNDHLYRTARSLVAKGLSAEAILAALLIENRARCRPPLDEREVRTVWQHASTQPDRAGFSHEPSPHQAQETENTEEPEIWPDPQPIHSELAPVSALDRRMLPPALADWVWDIAERAQCPPDFVAVGAITAMATVVGRKVGIRPKRHDDWTVVPNLWGTIVGRPGVLKSPALAEALRPLYRLVADAQAAYEKELGQYRATVVEQKAQREVLEARLKTAIKKGSVIEQIKNELAALKEDEPPVERRYITNDTTIEKLGELLNQNPNGLMVFRDELSGFLAAMDRQGHESDRAFYLEAWNGTGPFTYDRIGRGTLHINAACVSILGSIQPGPLVAYLREAFGGGRDDGFLQRFQLVVYPDTATVWRNVDRWPDSQAKSRAIEVFKALDTLNVLALGATQEKDDEIPYIRFSIDAQDFFDTWRADLEKRLRLDDEHPVIASHLAKYRSLMPSLALILHLVEGVGRDGTPGAGTVSLHAAGRAAAWCNYLEAQARRIYQSVTARAETSAGILAAKIRAGKLPNPFTAREVMKKGWTGLTTAEEIAPALDLLEELHWLRRQDVRPAVGRPGVRFRVNPKAKGAA